jgi:ABC-type branched-subunit amino acid transport system ATPase component
VRSSAVADRLVVIAGGRIRATGATAELLEGHDDIEEYYFGLTTTEAAATTPGGAR